MAASSQNAAKEQEKAKKTPDTVNLTPEELRRISGGAKIGQIPPSPTPPSPSTSTTPTNT